MKFDNSKYPLYDEIRTTTIELSREVILEIAPEEIMYFEDYIAERHQMKNSDLLAFGLGDIVSLFTPVVLNAMWAALGYLLGKIADTGVEIAKDEIKNRLAKYRKEKSQGIILLSNQDTDALNALVVDVIQKHLQDPEEITYLSKFIIKRILENKE
ncbi:hypothetical protein ACH5Y9_11150 [Methylomonas sp. BW4-1]|uniref:hypothetical protein n=1 Tax=Methylomonas sp. BW4-1 TaxID=3376685 RepID=UPI004041FC8D